MTLIFEAVLLNPNPELEGLGCAPVAQFWDGLKDIDDPQTLAEQLHNFYYTGLEDTNGNFEPVVSFSELWFR